MYTGTIEDGEKTLEPIRRFGTSVLDTVGPKPYVAHQKIFDPAVPHGLHYYWKSHKLGPLTDDSIEVVVEHAAGITSPLTTVPLFTQGGAMARIAEETLPFRTAMRPMTSTSSPRGDPTIPTGIGTSDGCVGSSRRSNHTAEVFM
ncbi:MAG TPA: hypothetical protein VG929_11950 [Actinomycetota bacterium]|nr:hypothetical protein [Actinomycetota bacterium]